MQMGLRKVAAGMVYRMRDSVKAGPFIEDDAVDVLVRGLPQLLRERGWMGGGRLPTYREV